MSFFDSTPWRVGKDLLKICPAIAWCITCLTALPFYARLGWPGPIICAVFSAIVCAWSLYDILMFKCPAFALLSMQCRGQALEDNAEKESLILASSPLSKSDASVKLIVASVFAGLSIFFTIMFLAVAYNVIKNEEYHKPCDGNCEGCVTDPNCSAWTERVQTKYPIVGICPPAHDDADTNVTFSCLADGYWMVVTSIVGCVWAVMTYQINKATQNTEAKALDTHDTEESDEVTIELA
jgi:hypothetical protein